MIGGVGIVVLAGILILTRPFTEAPWPESSGNPQSIYQAEDSLAGRVSSIPVVSPFHLHTEPMAGLFLANFEGDPDRIYIGLEPQSFDDDIHGRGILVIGWRVDGQVDVFHSPGLRLDPQGYGIAGMGLHMMVEQPFTDARFELGPNGAQVDIQFQDLEGREIHLFVMESDTRPRRPFGFLAPMGSAASDPPALPLVYVHDFYFVRRAGSEVRIEIDGRLHRSDPIPLLLDWTWVHFLRYTPDPFIVTWNPSTEQRAEVLELQSGTVPDIFHADARGVRYELAANGDFREIRSMSRTEGAHEVTVEFSPGFPHLLALRDDAEVTGAFRISAHHSAGTVTGTWQVTRQDRDIHLEVIPSGGWTPADAPGMARALFRAVSMFRAWPTAYTWRATLRLPPAGQEAEGLLDFQSEWENAGL